MEAAIVGAGGMLGRKLAEHLTRSGRLADAPLRRLTLADAAACDLPGRPVFEVSTFTGDLADARLVRDVVASRPDVIFHLAAVVSGEAEADFELGYRVNLDGTRALLDAVRAVGAAYRPRFVFASSIAVFGPPFPDAIDDDLRTTPQTSYGTQKAIAELLVADYTRRGFLDGIALRLPTICVRPGPPNAAASGFFSSIVREPLNGRTAVLPVGEDVRHWFASPRSAVEFLVHAAELDSRQLGTRRALVMPGVSATVAEEIAAVRRVGGDGAVALIRREPDERIARIVASWPARFDARRAEALGFRAERDFDEIVDVYVEDELGGRVGGAPLARSA